MEKIKKVTGSKGMGLLALGLILCGTVLSADIKLPAVLGDHMVLQREQPIRVWGWAEPGEGISVAFANKDAQTSADMEGKWEVQLDPVTGSLGPHKMTITGTRSPQVVLDDILLGEVWVCSGQSNMEWEMSRTHSPTPEIRRADHPSIRLFHVPRKTSPYP